MTRGFALKETLLGCAVLFVAAGIVLGIGLSMRRRTTEDIDAERMRKVFLAVSMYQESFAGQPPPDLAAAGLYLAVPSAYQAANDPFLSSSGPYPNDGSLPDGPKGAPYRISFAYLYAHQMHWPNPKWTPYDLALQPNLGLLANEWTGSVEPQESFHANVGGPVLRLNMDGALLTTKARGVRPLGDVRDLFGFK